MGDGLMIDANHFLAKNLELGREKLCSAAVSGGSGLEDNVSGNIGCKNPFINCYLLVDEVAPSRQPNQFYADALSGRAMRRAPLWQCALRN